MKYTLVIIFSGLLSMSFDMPPKKLYPVGDIPEALFENAVAVVREHNETFEIHSVKRATRTIKHVVTVLDKNGDDLSIFNVWYDKLRSIDNIEITIYDRNGNIIKKVWPQDIEDYSSFSSFSIYDDNRQKIYRPVVKSYPYTISYSYELTHKGLFNYPIWQPLLAYDMSVENSKFLIITPPDFIIRYKESNMEIDPVINSSAKETTYLWEVSSIPAVEKEDYSPNLYENTGVLYTAPCDFSIEGYDGNMSTWENMGLWGNDLLIGRDEISDKTKAEVAQLVEGVSDKTEKVRRVYKFMQSRTRYVSIQVGIGGWQPFPAITVDEDGYGDCKALANYTMVLLREAGIESYYTWVRAGRNIPDIRSDFVSNQFNHIIVCVPMENDTIWLETTSQVSPFGYIGNFTEDRNVLLVTPDGGKLVKTRTYTKDENLQLTRVEVDLTNENSGSAFIESTFAGLQYNNVSSLLRKSAADREKWLYTNTDIENIKIQSYDIKEEPETQIVPVVTSKMSIDLISYGSTTGDRLFIPLNLMNRLSSIPSRNRDRKSDIVLRFPFTDIDSISYSLPDGYAIESAPGEANISTVFGDYNVIIKVEGNKVLYVRRRSMNKGSYPASSYNDFRQFYIDMSKMDNCKIVLKKESN